MKQFCIVMLASLFGLVPCLPAGLQDDWMEPGEPQPVQPLSFDGKEFHNAFNSAADQVRLVIVFSPT